jgi:hypothetical protein
MANRTRRVFPGNTCCLSGGLKFGNPYNEPGASLALSREGAASVRTVGSSVYGWFIEGFDTLDLKESKALLAELAS